MPAPDEMVTPFSLLNPLVQEILGPCSSQESMVRAVFVSSINGSGVVDGVSGGLGNSLDFEVLLAARSLADAIVVGAATVRAEGYGGVKLSDAQKLARKKSGQSPVPPLVIVSRRGDFAPDATVFAGEVSPIIVRSHEDALTYPSPAVNAGVCEQILLPQVTMKAIVFALGERGYRQITCEGGPSIYSALFREDLVDVVNWTIDPSIVFPNLPVFAGNEPNGIGAVPLPPASRHRFQLEAHVATSDGVLFLRYRRSR